MKVDDLLVEKLGENGFAAKKVAKRLKKEFYSVEFTNENITLKKAHDKIVKIGKIVEENDEEGFYLITVGSGFLNMNPAIVIVKLTDKKIKIVGYAKEGLIKQNTAKKAVDRIAKLLK